MICGADFRLNFTKIAVGSLYLQKSPNSVFLATSQDSFDRLKDRNIPGMTGWLQGCSGAQLANPGVNHVLHRLDSGHYGDRSVRRRQGHRRGQARRLAGQPHCRLARLSPGGWPRRKKKKKKKKKKRKKRRRRRRRKMKEKKKKKKKEKKTKKKKKKKMMKKMMKKMKKMKKKKRKKKKKTRKQERISRGCKVEI